MNASGVDLFSAKAIERIEDCFMGWVVASLDEWDSSRKPEIAYEMELAGERASIKGAFSRLYQTQDPGEQQAIEEAIVDHARKLEILTRKHDDAKEVSNFRSRHIAQELCVKMISAFGPTIIRRSLEQMPGDIASYLPRAALGVEDGALQPRSGNPATYLNRVHADNNQAKGAGDEVTGHGAELCVSEKGDQPPTKRRRVSDHMNRSRCPSTERCFRDPAGEATDTDDGSNHQQSNSIGDAQNDESESVNNTSDKDKRVAEEENTSFQIVDADGVRVAYVKPAGEWIGNDRTQTAMKFPFKNIVTIRQRRKARFIQNDLNRIHDQARGKGGTRLLSCIIQATGEIMDTPCQACKKIEGPFEGCVSLRHSRVSKCGNCEWTHHACRGASTADRKSVQNTCSGKVDTVDMSLREAATAFSNTPALPVVPAPTIADSHGLILRRPTFGSVNSIPTSQDQTVPAKPRIHPRLTPLSPSHNSAISPGFFLASTNCTPAIPNHNPPSNPNSAATSPGFCTPSRSVPASDVPQQAPPNSHMPALLSEKRPGGICSKPPFANVHGPAGSSVKAQVSEWRDTAQAKSQSGSGQTICEGAQDEFGVSGLPETDTDSYSGDALTRTDFRILQVKTRLFTTDERVTQYWSWVDDGKYFEHQVLKDTEPVKWGVLRDPVDFDIRPNEISVLKWSKRSLCVHLEMNDKNPTTPTLDGTPRGNIMAVFKKDTTLKRFLKFCGKLNIWMYEEKPDHLDSMWRTMPSQCDLDDEATVTLAMMC